MIRNIESIFYTLWDHAIWLNEIQKDEVYLFYYENYSDRLFGLISVDQGSNDDHCQQCRDDFLLMKFSITDFCSANKFDYLSAVCSLQKLKRIQINDLSEFNKHCVLIGDITNQPDVCFQIMKEINERNY